MKDDLFEKYWKEQFDDFETRPDSEVWNKMSQELFVRQTKSLFRNFFVNPSSRVWRKIWVALWWKSFIRFSPYTFNIYYLTLAVFSTVIFGSLIDRNNNVINELNPSNNSVSYNDPRAISSYLDKPGIHKEENTNNIAPKQAVTFNNLTQNNNLKNPQPLADINNFNEKKPVEADTLTYLSSLYPTINNSGINEKFDTLNVNNKLFDTHRSLSFYFGPSTFNPNLIYSGIEENSLNTNYSPLDANLFDNYSLSFFYEWHKFNVEWQIGLSYISQQHQYRYNDAKIFNDTLFQQQIIDNSFYNYSYTQVLNLDTLLLTGDTVWMNYVDSTLVADYDTLNTTTIQSKRTDKPSNQKFSIKAFDLPVMAGYSYSFGSFDITLKAGASLTYIYAVKGYIPSTKYDYGTEAFNSEKINNFYFNVLAGAEANYFITDKLSVSIMPLYKKNLGSLIKNSLPAKLNYNSINFLFGIKYQIR